MRHSRCFGEDAGSAGVETCDALTVVPSVPRAAPIERRKMEKTRSDQGNAASSTELLQRLAHLPVERDTVEHYRGYLSRQLVINRCADCGRWHHPMRPMCPACWSGNVEATPVSGRGIVYLFMLLHQGPPADGVDYSRQSFRM
jgi:hypothetical protein